METRLLGKKTVVVGLQKSGVAASNLLIEQGARVVATDLKGEDELKREIQQLSGPVRLSLGRHNLEDFLSAELVVVSPGVPASLPQLREARQRGIPVWSEIELAYRFLSHPIVGITGSNGKSTTTSLVGQMFARAGYEAPVVGNIGTPLISAVQAKRRPGVIVAELSSFQLELTDSFRCRTAVMLNLTPDHLDRHGSFESYAACKARIFRNQQETDTAILNADDPQVMHMVDRLRSRTLFFSRKQELETGVWVKDSSIMLSTRGKHRRILDVRELQIPGNHNVENVLAAAAVAMDWGLHTSTMAATFRDFKGIEHRMEHVDRLDGVDYFNDSKATNVDSVKKALEALDQPLIVILGGKDKGGDFRSLVPLLERKARRVILIGSASQRISEILQGSVHSEKVQDLDEAVLRASQEASSGDAVLLSPGCASFDMFENFEERGRLFKAAVERIRGDKEVCTR